jgi:hypothetical protein
VLFTTGFVNTAFRVGSMEAICAATWWPTPLGRLLAFKLELVATIPVLPALHDFAVGPQAAEHMRRNPDPPATRWWWMAASLMGRLNLLLALAVVPITVALVHSGF